MSLKTACNVFALAIFLCMLIGMCNADVKYPETRNEQNETLPIVTITQGTLQGITLVSRYNRSFSAFLGIPYAQPPIGNLRFSNPVPAGNWSGTLDASMDGVMCPQEYGGEEDCLYLNVFTPKLPGSNDSSLLPVMVSIPGGGFNAGGGYSSYYGPGYLLDADIVLVSVTYRLGPLGFFSTGDEVAPGNWGLKDQVLALQWVQDNIAYFGGDRDHVTIFGQSAGGASVQLLALSDSTIGLFHKYISQSGAALGTWAYRPRSSYANIARQLGQFLNCPTNTSTLLVDCLRGISASDIINTQSQFYVWQEYPFVVWSPTDEPDIEGAFLTNDPAELLAAGKIRDLPSITGTVKHEAIGFVPGIFPDSDEFGEFLDNFDDLVPIILQYSDRVEDVQSFTAALKEFYFNNDLTTNRTQVWSNCVDLFSDAMFIYPVHNALRKHLAVAENPAFFYSFEYRGTYSINNIVYDRDGTALNGKVVHADDLLYLFPQLESMYGILPEELSEADRRITDSMVELWTSFVIDGIPTTTAKTSNTTWVAYSSEDNYLRIGSGFDPALDLEYNFIQERMQFWNELTASTESGNIPMLTIPQGTLQGISLTTRYNRSISGFLGIPYAQPPIGNLRFSSPLEAEAWTGTLNANTDGSPCVQEGNVGNEDCLYLNVFTPQLPENADSPLLPVMVSIPGGGFEAGDGGSATFGPDYLLDEDIVLVSINYRLGPLGFLSTGDDVAPGNWGMKDQVLALKWVQKNIANFGGDPDQVTIFGESAGGASVQLLALSDSTIGLFHKFISQSGSAFGFWVHQPRSIYANLTLQLGKLFDCPTDTSSSLVDCLRNLDAFEITNTRSELVAWDKSAMLLWGPTDEPDIDGAFLTDAPANLIADGKIRDVPSMTGTVKDEGLFFTPGILPGSEIFQELLDNFDELLPIIIQYSDRVEDEKSFTAALKKFYFNNDLSTNRTQVWSDCVDLFSDALFIYPVYNALQKQLAFATHSSFLYSFEYSGGFSINHLLDPTGTVLNDRVMHSEDLYYLFSMAAQTAVITEVDEQMIDTMVQLWTSFAINGIPTTAAKTSNTTWTAYSSEDNYLRIGSGSDGTLDLRYNFRKERMQFWNELMTATGSGSIPTISSCLILISVTLTSYTKILS